MENKNTNKKKWNFWVKVPFVLFLAASILDLTFTTRNYLVLKVFTEINPLYTALNNYWLFLIVNIALTTWVLLFYKNKFDKPSSIMSKYTIFVILLGAGCMRLYGFWSNFKWVLNPVTDPAALQTLQTKVAEQGAAIYSGLVLTWLVCPFVVIIGLFWMFQKAVKLKEE